LSKTPRLLLACVASFAFAILLWLVFLQPKQALSDEDTTQTDSAQIERDEASVDRVIERNAIASDTPPVEQQRVENRTETTSPDAVISGVVIPPAGFSSSELHVRLIARAWKRDHDFDAHASWEFANSFRIYNSIPLQADGGFEFRRELAEVPLDSIWRLEVRALIPNEILLPLGNVALLGGQPGGQAFQNFNTGRTPEVDSESIGGLTVRWGSANGMFLPLHVSSSFRISPQDYEHQFTLQPQPPIEIEQEFRGFASLPHETLHIGLELQDPKLRASYSSVFDWSLPPSIAQPSFSLRVMMSNEMQGRTLDASMDFLGRAFPYSTQFKIENVTPGLTLLDPIDAPALGVVEVRIPHIAREGAIEDSAESPELDVGLLPWKSNKTIPDFLNFSEHPWKSERLFQPGLSLGEPSPGSWDGHDYITRIGWIPAGEYTLAGEWDGHSNKIQPQRVHVRAWEITRVTAAWNDDQVTLQVTPSPAPEPGDEYVISAFAVDTRGTAHPINFGFQLFATDIQVPADTVEIAVLTQFTQGDRYRWSCYRGRIPASGIPDQLELRREGAIQQLSLTELPRGEANYMVTELRPPSSIWGGQPIRFNIQSQSLVEIVGFPPGTYQMWVGAQQRGTVGQIEFWRDVQLGG